MHQADAPSWLPLIEARHNVLEAFAVLESTVIAASHRFGAAALGDCASLGQRLEALGNVKAGSALSKTHRIVIVQCVESAKAVLSVRNDIVHSQQHVVKIGEVTAIYQNTGQSLSSYPTARTLTVSQHEKLCRNVAELSRKISTPCQAVDVGH